MFSPDEILLAAATQNIDVDKFYHQKLFSTQSDNIATTGNAKGWSGTGSNPWETGVDAFDGNDSTSYRTASFYDDGSYSVINESIGQEWSSNTSFKISAITFQLEYNSCGAITFQPQTYDGSTWSDHGSTVQVAGSLNTQYSIPFSTPVTNVKGLRLKVSAVGSASGTAFGIYDVEYIEIQSKQITVGWNTVLSDWMLELKRLDDDEDWRTINTKLGLNKSQAYNLTDAATTLTDALTRSGNTITVPASLLKIGAEYVVKIYRVARGHFDIQIYSGTGETKTVLHDLGVAPCAFRGKAWNKSWPPWFEYHKPATANNHLRINQTNGAATGSTVFNDTEPTASNITVGSGAFVNQTGANFCVYLWGASGIYDVKKYSTTTVPYTINTDWAIQSATFKNIDVSSDWVCLDKVRDTANPADECIDYNSNAKESTGTNMIDFESSGLKILATAENPMFSTGNNIDVFVVRAA